MTPTLIPTPLYRPPDGWTISYGDNALIVTDDDLNFVIVPIGREGLLELSKKLYDIGMKGQHTSQPTACAQGFAGQGHESRTSDCQTGASGR